MAINLSFKDAVEYISQNYQISDYLTSICGTPNKTHGNKKWYLCPLHNEKTPSFVVDTESNRFKCYGCNKYGNIFNLDMDYNNLSFHESVLKLSKSLNISINPTNESKNQSNTYSLLHRYVQLGNKDGIVENNKRMNENLIHEYQMFNAHELISRNELYDIGLISSKGQFLLRDRYAMPIYNQYGIICGLIGERKNPEQEPKYLYSIKTPIFDKKNILWGYHKLSNKTSYIILVEGVYDSIKLNTYCLNSVASLGTAISTSQINQLNNKTKNVILFFDNDEAGRRAV